ncbi:hypothetical protein L6452_22549 [Arctium lappa]|uniref:Uncharacterized protein n=1 Tax=Arctium lappa TaxID=4217 RepID=A0ACB9B1U5_ARCLA|nr:hypothetical protein L6452_22549 [Arctium lappa]
MRKFPPISPDSRPSMVSEKYYNLAVSLGISIEIFVPAYSVAQVEGGIGKDYAAPHPVPPPAVGSSMLLLLLNFLSGKESDNHMKHLVIDITTHIGMQEAELALRVNSSAYNGDLAQLKSLIRSETGPNKKIMMEDHHWCEPHDQMDGDGFRSLLQKV